MNEPEQKQPMKELEPKSILVDKIIKAYELKKADIAECVELYYDAQDLRIKHKNRERTEGPGELVSWLAEWLALGEKVITGKLKVWVESDDSPPEAKWAYEQYGIGPILASGLAAHIDVEKAPSVSSVWKFAGLAPGFDKRIKGQKSPYNGRLKVLAWKIAESFMKVSGKEGAVYGRYYKEYKAEEVKKNEAGLYKEAAKYQLSIKDYKKDNVTRRRLLEGKLSDDHLQSRAFRKTAKLFLSHYWIVGRKARGLPIRPPYSIGPMGHDGMIEPIE